MNNDLDLTFLSRYDFCCLKIFGKYTLRAAITDFAIFLGGDVSLSNYVKNDLLNGLLNNRASERLTKTSAGEEYANFLGEDASLYDFIESELLRGLLKCRTGRWWTKIPMENEYVRIGNILGDFGIANPNWSRIGIRPVVEYSSISKDVRNVRILDEIKEVEFGEYPQYIVNKYESDKLESLYINNELLITGKNYTTNSVSCRDYKTPFKARVHPEYEYNGSKYIRVVGDLNCAGSIMSDGRIVEIDKPYWIKVEPVVWFVDYGMAVCKKIIAAGIRFDNKEIYDGYFYKTVIKWYMDTYLSKDLRPSIVPEVSLEEPKLELKKKNC